MVCRADAPAVERFAREHRGQIEVVGLGSHGSLELARELVAERGVRTPRMLWDDQGAARSGLGVQRDPGAVLLDRGGTIRHRWLGPFDGTDVLRMASGL